MNLKDINKKIDFFRIFNIAMSITFSIFCIGLALYYGIINDENNRLGSAIVMAVVSILPLIIEVIFRKKIKNSIFLIINIYIFFAGIFGSVLNMYSLIWWYDTLIHCVMGYFIALLTLYVLCASNEHEKLKPITVALFCLFVSLGIELGWEIIERMIDVLFGASMQGTKVNGTNSPLINDTIKDMIANFIGAMIFFAHYIIDRCLKANFGFNKILKNFKDKIKK